MIDKDYQDFLANNIKGLMLSCVALLNEAQQTWVENSEFQTLREGDLRVFAQLRGRVLTISQLAREMGMSRQGAQQAVQRLQEERMVGLISEPNGGKGKCVIVTEKGERYRQAVATHLVTQERGLAERLGKDKLEMLRANLLELHQALKK